MSEINSIKQLVEFFGGDTAFAEFLGTTQTVVGQWKVRNQIASGWHLRILAEIHRRKAVVNPSVFGLTEEEAEGLFPVKRPLARRQSAVA